MICIYIPKTERDLSQKVHLALAIIRSGFKCNLVSLRFRFLEKIFKIKKKCNGMKKRIRTICL